MNFLEFLRISGKCLGFFLNFSEFFENLLEFSKNCLEFFGIFKKCLEFLGIFKNVWKFSEFKKIVWKFSEFSKLFGIFRNFQKIVWNFLEFSKNRLDFFGIFKKKCLNMFWKFFATEQSPLPHDGAERPCRHSKKAPTSTFLGSKQRQKVARPGRNFRC